MHGKMGDPDEAIKIYNDPRFDYYRDRAGQAISLMGGNNGNQEIHIELNRIFGNGSSSCNGGITIARGNPQL